MIGREFVKHIPLVSQRHEIITTRFELRGDYLVEHIVVSTHSNLSETSKLRILQKQRT